MQENNRHGKGIYYFANKDIYYGDFKNDKFNGSGKFHICIGLKF